MVGVKVGEDCTVVPLDREGEVANRGEGVEGVRGSNEVRVGSEGYWEARSGSATLEQGQCADVGCLLSSPTKMAVGFLRRRLQCSPADKEEDEGYRV